MNDDYSDLIQLWLLRILDSPETLSRFLKKDGFDDDDLARTLDLTKWIEPDAFIKRLLLNTGAVKSFENSASEADTFESQHGAIVSELQKRHSQLEKRQFGSQSYLIQNCQILEEALELTKPEVALLQFMVLNAEFRSLRRCIRIANLRSQRDYLKLIAKILNLQLEELMSATRPEGILLTIGLIGWDKPSSDDHHPILEFSCGRLSSKLVYRECGIEQLMREVASPAPKPSLHYSDFPHMKEMLGYLRSHLRKALREGQTGVNMYLHGPPGTGKSELSRMIAREMRAALYEVSFEDKEGESIESKDRLSALLKAQSFLSKKRAILVFDEAEDVFRSSSFFSRSIADERKAWVNRILESNRVPTIWISNSVSCLDPAFARRFDFVCEIPTPPRPQRLKTFRRICGRSVSEQTLQKLVQSEELAPAVVARAKSVADGLAKTHGVDKVEPAFNELIRHTLKAQGHDIEKLESSPSPVPEAYSLSCLNPNTSIEGLDLTLREHPSCRLCLYGPPGTGKTTLGYWLAERLERPLRIEKASDLLSPYIGQAEKNIARAFAQAKDDSAILMIDEVDSFLQDRSAASRSWEVTQVNEMLTQIERFEGIFIASTNLMEGIDPAALRRFDLKLRFDYMLPEQSIHLMQSYADELSLGKVQPAAQATLENLTNCTPGDFANVARQHRFRKFQSPAQFAVAVEEECRTKVDRGRKPLGFN